MKKEIILLDKFQLTRGFGYIFEERIPEKKLWNELFNFCKDKKYLNHIIRDEWIENKEYPQTEDVKGIKVPVGDNYIYLDIYFEDK